MTGPVLVVGAGPNGLAVARALKLFGVPYAHVERHRDVGGIWDADNPWSPIYESAHFISSKTRSAFHGFPMPAHYPDYSGRQHVLDYVRGFADAFGLRESSARRGFATRSRSSQRTRSRPRARDARVS